MADDQGWGQTGYYNHSVLKTPNLDAMAANGLRFDRFYAGGPVCSPTRATVLTGRTHDRTGVFDHGYALRDQEKPLPRALKKAGYATGHFGSGISMVFADQESRSSRKILTIPVPLVSILGCL